MLRALLHVLLVFTAIISIYSQGSCPNFTAFSKYPNIKSNDLQNILNGTFLMAYTTASVVNCHRIKYVINACGDTTGHIESPGCCVMMKDLVFNSNQLDYTIGPVPDHHGSCPSLVDENGSMKLLATTGTGKSLCLIAAVCQGDYYGINVMCQGKPPPLMNIINILFKVQFGLIDFHNPFALRPVSQIGCVSESNICPILHENHSSHQKNHSSEHANHLNET